MLTCVQESILKEKIDEALGAYVREVRALREKAGVRVDAGVVAVPDALKGVIG